MNDLPCPFCGSSAIGYSVRGDIITVQCDNCESSGAGAHTQEGAMMAWNRRADTNYPLIKRIKKLENALLVIADRCTRKMENESMLNIQCAMSALRHDMEDTK